MRKAKDMAIAVSEAVKAIIALAIAPPKVCINAIKAPAAPAKLPGIAVNAPANELEKVKAIPVIKSAVGKTIPVVVTAPAKVKISPITPPTNINIAPIATI